jgi:DNA invertase Pin-like site-specific DNA recombinase
MNSQRAAVYLRVSTTDQTTENQAREVRAYVEARGWTAVEYVDEAVSGAKERRPALDRLVNDARRRRFDVVVCWRLDRLGRNLRHLVTLLDELAGLEIGFVSLGEAVDTSTPAGRLQLHVLAALAEFERGRISERVRAGLARVRAQGKRLGRPRASPLPDRAPRDLSVRQAATLWGVSQATASRRLSRGDFPDVKQTSAEAGGVSPYESASGMTAASRKTIG